MRGAAGKLRFKLAWNPCGDPGRKIKSLRHHSDDGIDCSLHGEVEFGEIRCTAEISLPIAIADDRCRRAVGALLVRHKSAAAKRLDTEGFKEGAGDCGDVDTHRLAAAGNR